ncbi:MAG: C25 family cysteine peptidase [Bacteroidota bacterium]
MNEEDMCRITKKNALLFFVPKISGVLLRLLFLFLFSFSLFLFSLSQPYWNEWINYSQKYYRIPVTQNGIYRLDFITLTNAGIPVSSINPKKLQLFFRGNEQYIYVKGENDNVFNSTDYIEFYGQYNNGDLDSTLYKGEFYDLPKKHPNPYYSLFNDTSAYFLTWNNSTSNNRITFLPDTNFSGYTSEDYFFKEKIIEKHENYYYGKSTTTGINFPEYHESEGWFGPEFNINNTYSIIHNTTNVYAGGRQATVKLTVVGASRDTKISPIINDHVIQIRYKNASNTYTLIDTLKFIGYVLASSAYQIPASQLGDSTEFLFTALTQGSAISRNAVAYVTIKYPHIPTLENKTWYEMLIPDDSIQGKSYYSFSNFDDQTSPVYLYDISNHLMVPVVKNGSRYQVLVPNGGGEKFCIVKSEKQYFTSSLTPVNGNGYFTNYLSIASSQQLDSAFIIITHKSLIGNATSGAIAYANYRASAAGGGKNVLIVDIDDLYEQFGFGIRKSPFSIRHFADFCLDKFSSEPQYLFLMGKSVKIENSRNHYANSLWGDYLANYSASLIPSMGCPASDNMLVAGLNGLFNHMPIAVGRLAAQNPNHISIYLNKVIEYESLQPAEWMKHVLHLGGGLDQNQQAVFCNSLSNYANIIKDTLFGGYVHQFCKNASSPTQISFTDSIKMLMNSGLSLITFFGHSSASVFEFGTLPPDQYQNINGKYPFYLAFGCVSGDIHMPPATNMSSGESFILSSKGTIGFLASSGPGTAIDMELFGKYFYKNISYYLYGQPVGKNIQRTIDNMQRTGGTNAYTNAVCREMTLHGDPAIKIHSYLLPDYSVDNSSIYFSPSYISTDIDSFNVNVIVTNIGKATRNRVPVSLKRIFPDGTSDMYYDTIPYVLYKDTLTFRILVDPIKGGGINKFELKVDADNIIAETEDILNNNLVGANAVLLMIYSGDVVPIYPYQYAIVPDDTITLKASTVNSFEPIRNYIFEIDTTDLFNSTIKKTQHITQSGGVLKATFNKWLPSNLVLADSTVYFWRVRRDTSDTANFKWRESSFHYIPDKRGWGQSHFFQFLKGDKFQFIDTVRSKRKFEFLNTNISLFVQTLNYNYYGGTYWSYINVILNAERINTFAFNSSNAIIAVVIDSISGKVWLNSGNGDGGSEPVNNLLPRYEFLLTTEQKINAFTNFLQSFIPCGSIVALYTPGNHKLDSILNNNTALLAAFRSVGAVQISSLKRNVPYILIGKKCGSAIETVGDSIRHIISASQNTIIKRNSGNVFSEIIGPASRWGSLHWKYAELENPSKDLIQISIVGIKQNGSTNTLAVEDSKSLDVYNLYDFIDASVYPFLQLIAHVKDDSLVTPPQVKRWQIYYDGVPEAALNPSKYFSFYSPSVQQGDSIKMKVAIENIGDYNMDSLWVDFWVYDANRNKYPLPSAKLDSLRINKSLIAKIALSSKNIPGGINSLWIEANPFNAHHQSEQYHFNNIGTSLFNVSADAINPVLDVTFDGVHIMNGDIVSAKPTIAVKLKDENKFLALNDTSDFEVYLMRPSQTNYSRIHFSKEMLFYPATLPNNSCRIIFAPTLPQDGTYYLMVQAKDRSGNYSGNTEYKISFEVVNKATITHVLNYPNPFSTSTRFVFTLTGSEVPDYLKIQIMTITGKTVKEINRSELGLIHIGRNITEYAWDGKDEFGDQLANGIYLYRVMTQLNGKVLEHCETEADSYFTKEFGKMFLMR